MTNIAQIKRPVWAKTAPHTWNVVPIRSVLKERKEKNTKLEETNILSVMKDVGVIRYEDKGNVGNKSSDRPEAYKIVRPNDLVLNSMNLSIGSVGISRESGVTSSVYIIYRVIAGLADADFFNYLFQTRAFQRHLASYGRGIMELREAVKERDIRNQPVVLPPLETQKKIAAFLDEKTKAIDALVEKKEKLIALLREKRQSLITQVVTKGLDPKVKMKPSGVEWIGSVPNSWEKVPLKFLFSYQSGGVWGDEARNDDHDVICVRVADFDFDNFSANSNDFTYRNIPDIKKDLVLDNHSILLEKSGGGDQQPVGRAVRYLRTEKATCSNFIQKLQVKKTQNPEFIVLLLSMLYFSGVTLKVIKKTTGIQNLDLGAFLRTDVFLPPTDQQDAIVRSVVAESMKVSQGVRQLKGQIERLKEYRAALIYAAVTGKIKI